MKHRPFQKKYWGISNVFWFGVKGSSDVLVGQPEFENRINSQGLRQMKQQIKIRCQIRRLTREESQNYIDHRLKLVGSSSSQVFTSKAFLWFVHMPKEYRHYQYPLWQCIPKGLPPIPKKDRCWYYSPIHKDMESPFLRKPFLSTITRHLKNSVYSLQGRVRNWLCLFYYPFTISTNNLQSSDAIPIEDS